MHVIVIDGQTSSEPFAATISRWLADTAFRTDTVYRNQRLTALMNAMEDAHVDADVLTAVGTRITDIFGNSTTMVRFRSSSNAEDSLSFNGAGLYDSTSACLADEVDGDSLGPSRCDDEQGKERTIRRALTKVWASLWNPKAFEEREWYGVDHTAVQMAILVNTRTKNERANIVAFSGNPANGEDVMVVNAQAGELDVVSAEPGVFPETSHLKATAGNNFEINRIAQSSEVLDNQVVLTDAQLIEIARVLSILEQQFPVDAAQQGDTWFLDTEWKLTRTGELVIKQIRPFAP